MMAYEFLAQGIHWQNLKEFPAPHGMLFSRVLPHLKGTSGRKKKLNANERAWEMQKKRAITDLNAPNGPRDIPFQSQTSPFCRFLASIPLKYDVTDTMLQEI